MIRTIAEIGINHNGDFGTAIRLQDAAHDAGAWAVKYQIRSNFYECVPKRLWGTKRRWQGEELDLFEYRSRLEFSDQQLGELYQHAKALGMEWFASPWDRESVGRLAAIQIDYCKVASAHVTNYNLLAAIRGAGFQNVFLSTGMSYGDDVNFASQFIKGDRHLPTVIPMACTSVYPCPPHLCNLGRLKRMCGFPSYGYSGHESGILPSLYAAVLGATFIERHLTLDKTQEGSDHAASLEPHEFKELCERLAELPAILGSGEMKPIDEELPAIERLRS